MKSTTLNLTSPVLTAMHPGNPHGLRFADGDGGDTGSGSDGTDDDGDGSQDDSGDGDDADDSKGDDDSPWADPDKAKAEIERLRRENAKKRVDPKEAAKTARDEVVQELGKALGLIKDGDDAPDPTELTQQVQAAQAAAREAAVELAVFKVAGKHQGDPNALLDSRTFLAKVSALDPQAEDFTSKVDAAIKDAVTDNPKLKAAPVAGASSADHAGGSGEGQTRTPKSLTDAVAGAYSG
ncbi:hypothetical protein [Ornithinimicrobium sufpigmenti]|uniref:hypothetical protein n=1 Tax=Ornithinimicrobium sufpigmenti TaxID=2508882 RepID=UPI0010361F19|nr:MULTISPECIES: hypothetical protein [unclassified Ornithinimicrobium]